MPEAVLCSDAAQKVRSSVLEACSDAAQDVADVPVLQEVLSAGLCVEKNMFIVQ